jgi:hypothetical protein
VGHTTLAGRLDFFKVQFPQNYFFCHSTFFVSWVLGAPLETQLIEKPLMACVEEAYNLQGALSAFLERGTKYHHYLVFYYEECKHYDHYHE